jgi:septum formation protein
MTVDIYEIILASSSPRRHELLSGLGYNFRVVAPSVEEKLLAGENPVDHVFRLSLEKARLVATKHPEALVVGADTVVVLGDIILGKPSSPDEATGMLKLLSGKEHTVYTGLSMIVRADNVEISDYDSTKVTFNELDSQDLLRYVASGESMDKAGAYGIQGMGSFLVKRYEGEFDTVIGFPTRLFTRMLGEVISCRSR